ncbi:hypothetical protein D9611_008330 [Ephemerocybe angulata]|uniref:Uncharacterized protein n=1 Tax=Ephemerocybe angulata TaxID=980116 RepID=A0A8H5BK01_9AGAR|nr:hypothetical protein D9611_008330 [Tulosesus angulatus]
MSPFDSGTRCFLPTTMVVYSEDDIGGSEACAGKARLQSDWLLSGSLFLARHIYGW